MGVGGSDDRFWHSKHFLYVVLVMSVLVGITALGGLLYFFTGFGGEAVAGQAYVSLLDSDRDGVPNARDCRKYDASVWQIQYVDSDYDGYGDSETSFCGGSITKGYSLNGDDCDDSISEITTIQTYFLDYDNDGWGSLTETETSCVASDDYVGVAGDPDDFDPTKLGLELCGDDIDNDDDGYIDDGSCQDVPFPGEELLISSCNTKIGESGNYYLDEDLVCDEKSAIRIGNFHDDVDYFSLDCQGNTIYMSSSSTAAVVFWDASDMYSYFSNCFIEGPGSSEIGSVGIEVDQSSGTSQTTDKLVFENVFVNEFERNVLFTDSAYSGDLTLNDFASCGASYGFYCQNSISYNSLNLKGEVLVDNSNSNGVSVCAEIYSSIISGEISSCAATGDDGVEGTSTSSGSMVCTEPYGDVDGNGDIDRWDLDTLLYVLQAVDDSSCGGEGEPVCDYSTAGYYVCDNGGNNYLDTSLDSSSVCSTLVCMEQYGDVDGNGAIDRWDLDTLLYILQAVDDSSCGGEGEPVCDYSTAGYYVCDNGENNYIDSSIDREYTCV